MRAVGLSEQVTDAILGLVEQYGLFAIFFGLILDSAMILPFVPGELLLVLAVNEHATNPATLLFVVLVCTAGTVVGSFLLFLLAKYGGRKFIMNHPKLFLMDAEKRDKLERTFRRPLGQSLVLIFRFFPFLRIIVSLPAGLARMPNLRFLILTTIGSFCFNAAVMYVLYESKQPNSRVVATVTMLREDYGEPLVDLAMANLPWVVLGVFVLGLLSMFRRNFRMVKNPKVPTRNTILGTLAVTALFWGGVLLIVGMWTDPIIVYDLIAKSGFDIVAATDQYFLGPLFAAMGLGMAACLVALMLIWIRQQFVTAATRKRRILKAQQRRDAEDAEHAPPVWEPPTRPPPSNEA